MEQTLQNRAVAELHRLLDENTTYYPWGFSIALGREEDAWDRTFRAIGLRQTYDAMADYVCRCFERKYGKPFLFSNDCVAYEIEYHTDAYMTMMGYTGYVRNVTTFLFSRESLIEHCRVIDISVKDVDNFRQRTMFGYRRGIRDCYRGTERDPFRN